MGVEFQNLALLDFRILKTTPIKTVCASERLTLDTEKEREIPTR